MLICKLTNTLTGKCYVGQTTNSLAHRLRAHWAYAACRDRSRSPLHDAISRYGRAAFRAEVLERCESQEELNAAEGRWIDCLNTHVPTGYNLREGGANGRLPESTKAKLRGRTPSESTRAKQRVAMRIVAQSPEWRARVAAAHRGRPAHPNMLKGLAIGWTMPRPPRPGEQNPRALLTDADVREIRRRYAAGEGSQQAIADEYGVKQVTVSAIVRRRTWRHVSEPVPKYSAVRIGDINIPTTPSPARLRAVCPDCGNPVERPGRTCGECANDPESDAGENDDEGDDSDAQPSGGFTVSDQRRATPGRIAEPELTDYRRLEYGWDEPHKRAFRPEPKNPVVRVIFTRLATARPLGDPSDTGGDAVIEIEHRTGRRERLRQRIVRHSPDGMEFSYAGSGPADCAANVLALILPIKEAWRLHQAFKWAFIARLPRDGGTIEMADVRAWVEAHWAREDREADEQDPGGT